jgi:hypothetical protein
MRVKAILLAAGLAAAMPAAVRAQNAAVNKDAMAFLSATYLECGTYYYAVAMCTVDERDKYNEMARTLFERSVDIDGIVESPEEYIAQKIGPMLETMVKKTEAKCSKVDVLHKSYRALCKNAYDGK